MDFESIIKNDNGEYIKHRPFLVCAVSDDHKHFEAYEKEVGNNTIIKQMLDKIIA